MREDTAEWLAPMTEEARRRGDIFAPALMEQAMFPAAEVPDDDNPAGVWVRKYAPQGTMHKVIDWIRFGALLRAELGWWDYPPCPHPECQCQLPTGA